MTDIEWREVCVKNCWLDVDEVFLKVMKESYEIAYEAGYDDGYENGKQAEFMFQTGAEY